MLLPIEWTKDGRPWTVLMGWLVQKNTCLNRDTHVWQSNASGGTVCLYFMLFAHL